jgi:hypothetical protein
MTAVWHQAHPASDMLEHYGTIPNMNFTKNIEWHYDRLSIVFTESSVFVKPQNHIVSFY